MARGEFGIDTAADEVTGLINDYRDALRSLVKCVVKEWRPMALHYCRLVAVS